MNDNFDRAAFIPKFADESKDRIQRLNHIILAFEKNPSNPELLKEIMRELHTIKGTARMMGFHDIVTLSHAAEDLFARINEKQLKPAKALHDVVFQALDLLEKLVEAKLKNTMPINIDEMCQLLEIISAGVDSLSSKSIPSAPSKAAPYSPLLNTPFIAPFQYESKDIFEEDIHNKTMPAREVEKIVRLGLNKVNALSNHFVELLMTRMAFHQRYKEITRLCNHAKQLKATVTDTRSVKNLFEELSKYSAAYESDIARLDTVIEGIRQHIMSMRMQPASTIFDLAARAVRDISRQCNKEANLLISGAEVELDNTIVEMLKEPLTHLLRNAIDHGIEEPYIRESLGKKKTGTILLTAKQEGGDVFITVEDDGKGMNKDLIKKTAVMKGLLLEEEAKVLPDEEIYRFILHPGFTTSNAVTDISGRGVGLDIVKAFVDRLHGSLFIESVEGQGVRFILKVPASISLMNVLMVKVGTMILAVPSSGVERIATVFWKDIKTLEGKSFIYREDQTISLVRMADIFMENEKGNEEADKATVIIFRPERGKTGFVVSELLYEEEVVFQEFKGYLKKPRYFSGFITLGTGEVVLTLDMQELITAENFLQTLPVDKTPVKLGPEVRNVILIAEDSMITAELEKNILINAGYEVDIAIDGIDAIEKLHKRKYDLLVTDIDMPGMNGFELTARVRADKRLKDMPVIIITSKEKNEEKRRGIEAGADAYILKKEFDQSNLLNVVKRLISE